MVHNHNLAKSIEHGYWREFRRLIEYKCAWYGKSFISVNKNNTTRCCWYCHKNSGKIGLGIEEWKCSNPNCPFHYKYHDRDINAAINILMLGLHWIKPETLQQLYNYAHFEFNSDLISGFNKVDRLCICPKAWNTPRRVCLNGISVNKLACTQICCETYSSELVVPRSLY